MTPDEKSEKGTGAQGKTISPAGAQAKILWDASNMRSNYANVSNVTGTQEEIILLFGMNQAWHAGQEEVKIQLSDRIILSPFVAKRLSLLLDNVLKDYEKRYGVLDIGVRRPDDAAVQ